VHRNSLSAYHGTDFSAREAAIVRVLADSSVPLSDRDIMERLGFTDANSVRPRITGLLERHILCEAADVKCARTGKTVRTVALAIPVQRSLTA
jgi:hypothetical protein